MDSFNAYASIQMKYNKFQLIYAGNKKNLDPKWTILHQPKIALFKICHSWVTPYIGKVILTVPMKSFPAKFDVIQLFIYQSLLWGHFRVQGSSSKIEKAY